MNIEVAVGGVTVGIKGAAGGDKVGLSGTFGVEVREVRPGATVLVGPNVSSIVVVKSPLVISN